MPGSKKENPAIETPDTKIQPDTAPPANSQTKNLFAHANRGLLLDIVVFLINVLLMRMLTGQFGGLINKAESGDEISEIIVFLFFVAIFVLPAAGAVLRRWHFHHRLQMQGKTMNKDGFTFGCLFNPILYYCLNVIIFLAIGAFVETTIYGNNEESNTFSIALVLLGLVIPTAQTYLIYRYFTPPKKDPSAFFKTPLSEALGDICIFLNMILFQVGLNWLMFSFLGFSRVSGISDFFSKLCFFIAIVLFIYFPPRIFYLAEDIYRRRVWLTMLLANAPLIFRALIGTK